MRQHNESDRAKILQSETYHPEVLLDQLIGYYRAKHDLGLSRILKIDPPSLSKIRNRRVFLSDACIIRIMEVTGWSLLQVQVSAGIPQLHARMAP